MVRASSVERALLFDIVVIEKGCAGGGLGLAVAGSWTCCLCVSGSGEGLAFADLWSDLGIMRGWVSS